MELMEITKHSDGELSDTSSELAKYAKVDSLTLLSEESRERYEHQYAKLVVWCESNKIIGFEEKGLIAYFTEKSKVRKPSTLWSVYSMLKTALFVKNDIDISQYLELVGFLKAQAVGFKANQSKIFTQAEVNKFLTEAPDDIYLMKKVVLIIGVAGGCKRQELVNLTIDDVEDKDSVLIVRVPNPKTGKSRIFTIVNDKVKLIDIYRQYLASRPWDSTTPRRLFLKYTNGRCAKQVVGMNIISKIPRDIAEFLNLPECELYTGRCFRRTSAKLLG